MCMRSISLLFFAGYSVPCSGLFMPCVQPDLSDRQQHRKLRSDGAAGAAGRHIQQRTWLAVVGFAVQEAVLRSPVVDQTPFFFTPLAF